MREWVEEEGLHVRRHIVKDQTRTVLLAALVGDLGVHRFYLGQPHLGALYLLFCWTGIPGVVASFEAYRYAFMSAKDRAERYSGGTLGKEVPRWLPAALIVLPLFVLTGVFAAIYAGYDF